MKEDIKNSTNYLNVNVNLEKMPVMLDNIGIKINVDVNVKNYLIKEYVITDSFEILVIVSVNVIKRVMLVNVRTMKIVKAERN